MMGWYGILTATIVFFVAINHFPTVGSFSMYSSEVKNSSTIGKFNIGAVECPLYAGIVCYVRTYV